MQPNLRRTNIRKKVLSFCGKHFYPESKFGLFERIWEPRTHWLSFTQSGHPNFLSLTESRTRHLGMTHYAAKKWPQPLLGLTQVTTIALRIFPQKVWGSSNVTRARRISTCIGYNKRNSFKISQCLILHAVLLKAHDAGATVRYAWLQACVSKAYACCVNFAKS